MPQKETTWLSFNPQEACSQKFPLHLKIPPVTAPFTTLTSDVSTWLSQLFLPPSEKKKGILRIFIFLHRTLCDSSAALWPKHISGCLLHKQDMKWFLSWTKMRQSASETQKWDFYSQSPWLWGSVSYVGEELFWGSISGVAVLVEFPWTSWLISWIPPPVTATHHASEQRAPMIHNSLSNRTPSRSLENWFTPRRTNEPF